VLAVTQRGHGDSGKPDGEYESRVFARDVASFMDTLLIERAVIVGHSMGSTVAQRFAVDHPQRVRGFAVDHPQRVRALVLAGAFFPRPANTEVRKFLEEVSTPSDPIDPAFVRDFQKSTLAQPVPPEFFDTVVGEAMKVPARVWRAALQPYLTVVRSRRRGSWSTKVPVTARIGKNQNASPARWRRSSRDSNWRPQFTPM
jgi:non-heme chloroperoxidase